MSKHSIQIPVSFLAAIFFAIVPLQSTFTNTDLTPY